MVSYGVAFFHTDMHPIYAHGTDQIVNRVGKLTVGDHVWLGAHATLLKNAVIPDGCIVGWGSVVSGRFTEPHSIIAGNPARQIPDRKIDWRPGDPRYIANAV